MDKGNMSNDFAARLLKTIQEDRKPQGWWMRVMDNLSKNEDGTERDAREGLASAIAAATVYEAFGTLPPSFEAEWLAKGEMVRTELITEAMNLIKAVPGGTPLVYMQKVSEHLNNDLVSANKLDKEMGLLMLQVLITVLALHLVEQAQAALGK